ncbi:hypothetical protein NL676_002541 [Syzygium grande]|nr:hypothetical protein NL676_002541 [Syzygium grande]
MAEKPAMVIGMDDSEHSAYALEWTLDRFFAPLAPDHPFKLFVVHARPSACSAVGLAGPGSADVLPFVEADLKRIASRVLEKAKEICCKAEISRFAGVPAREMLRDEETSPSPVVVE